jgi:diguanylate cyclase (GGDEF)-like protein/PAS domain S-box-containing protein
MAEFRDLSGRALADLLAALRRETVDPADLGHVVQDLQVHQIELEMQNRALREAQQALEESRDTYADLYDFAPVAYTTVSRLGQITRMNLTAAELLGVSRGQAPHLFLAARLAPGDGHVLLSALARVLASGAQEAIEVGLGRPPQPRRDLRLAIRRERPHPAGAAPVQCGCALFDVTEIRQAQAAVLAQQRFLQSIIDGVADPILVIGTDYRILLMNTAAQTAAGAPTANNAGLTCYRASHGRDSPCDSADHPCPVRQVLAGGTAVTVIHRHWGADGQPRWIELIGSPLRDASGAVIGVVESARDITVHRALTEQLQEREVQLEHLAQHDPLTGLPNRLLFTDRLHQAILQAHREHRGVALLFVDLDGFKSINDSLGHPAGDQVLQQAAARMRALVREGDTVARLGGDEFVLIIGTLEQDNDAGLVAHKLLKAFRQPFTVAGQSLYVTASIGISLFPQDGSEVDTLIRNADAAMYRAKDQGRDTLRFYTEDMTARAFAQVAIERDLREALARGEFVLHYQPEIELATGRIAGLEALIRWQHPARGLVAPDQFIPLAEATGLIVPISAWVVRTAAAQMKQWRDQGLLADAAVWVNLSNRDLQNRGLAEAIEGMIREVGLDPRALAVEITETWIMANPESAAGNIRHLQTLGIEVGIDDFGTGYSSLAALKHLAVCELKIDQSFVAGLPEDTAGCAIARAVIALSQALGIKVVAEGVETQTQADFLQREGCRIAQGYLFSRPLPAAEFEAYVRDRTAAAPDPRAGADGPDAEGRQSD